MKEKVSFSLFSGCFPGSRGTHSPESHQPAPTSSHVRFSEVGMLSWMQSVLPLYHTQPSIPGAAYTTTQQQIMIKERGGKSQGKGHRRAEKLEPRMRVKSEEQ